MVIICNESAVEIIVNNPLNETLNPQALMTIDFKLSNNLKITSPRNKFVEEIYENESISAHLSKSYIIPFAISESDMFK